MPRLAWNLCTASATSLRLRLDTNRPEILARDRPRYNPAHVLKGIVEQPCPALWRLLYFVLIVAFYGTPWAHRKNFFFYTIVTTTLAVRCMETFSGFLCFKSPPELEIRRLPWDSANPYKCIFLWIMLDCARWNCKYCDPSELDNPSLEVIAETE